MSALNLGAESLEVETVEIIVTLYQDRHTGEKIFYTAIISQTEANYEKLPEPLATNAHRCKVLCVHATQKYWLAISGLPLTWPISENMLHIGADPLATIVGCESVPTGLSFGGDLVRVQRVGGSNGGTICTSVM